MFRLQYNHAILHSRFLLCTKLYFQWRTTNLQFDIFIQSLDTVLRTGETTIHVKCVGLNLMGLRLLFITRFNINHFFFGYFEIPFGHFAWKALKMTNFSNDLKNVLYILGSSPKAPCHSRFYLYISEEVIQQRSSSLSSSLLRSF